MWTEALNTTLGAPPPPPEIWPTTTGCAYTWSSTRSVNTAQNCCTLTLLVVNAFSLSFEPDRVLWLCCVSTATDWGFVGRLFVRVSVQVASSRRRSGRGSVRFAMSHPQQVYRRMHEECPPSHDRASVAWACSRIDTISKRRASNALSTRRQ